MTELKNNGAWRLKPLRLDSPDGAITEVFRSAPEDAYGRGIALTVTDGGSPMSLADCTVCLAWSDPTGACGVQEFAPTNPREGYFEVEFPPGMAKNAPCDVRACVMIHMPGGAITSSREFAIHVRRPIITDDAAMADDNFSAFVQGMLDLRALDDSMTEKLAAWTQAEDARASAERSRKSAEDDRKTAESARAAAETARQESFYEWLETRDAIELAYVDGEVATAAIRNLF